MLYTIDLKPGEGELPEDSFDVKPPEGGIEVSSVPEMFSAEGGRMADFTLPSLTEGKEISLSDYKGQVVFVDFFATWCGPCRAELPKLQELYEKYKDKGFTVIAVDVNESRETVEPFVENMRMTMPVAMDLDGSLMRAGGFRSFPTLVVLDKNHIVQNVHQGYRPGMEKQLAEEIELLLEEKTGGKD